MCRVVAARLAALFPVLVAGCLAPSAEPAPEEVRAVGDQIAYVGQDDQVYLARADGSARRQVSREIAGLSAAAGWAFRWPTYSPDGRRLAFAAYRERQGRVQRAAIVAADLRAETAAALLESSDLAPIYLYWAPDSRRLSALVQRAQELELLLLDAARPGHSQLLAQGNPLYWSWAPHSRALAVHLGGDARVSGVAWHGLLHLDSDGAREERFSDRPGGYRAPAWSSDGAYLAYVALVGGVPILSVRDREGQVTRLTPSNTDLAFAWAPGSDRLAYASTVSAGAQIYQGVEVARADGSQRRRLTADTLAAFFWAPDGTRLAYVGVDPAERALYWAVVGLDGKEPRRLPGFIPSDDFAFQLPFFDQYAQSIQLWSPDGRRLVYAAERQDQRANGSTMADQVHLLELEPEPRDSVLAPGRAAVWAPRAAGGP